MEHNNKTVGDLIMEGISFFNKNDIFKAFDCFKQVHILGYSDMVILHIATIARLNNNEAMGLLTHLAENGNKNAQRELGICYNLGMGVEKDIKESYKWWEKAAKKGDEFSIIRINEYKNEDLKQIADEFKK